MIKIRKVQLYVFYNVVRRGVYDISERWEYLAATRGHLSALHDPQVCPVTPVYQLAGHALLAILLKMSCPKDLTRARSAGPVM